MQVERLDIDGLVVLTPRRFHDSRGWFEETWNAARMAEAGLDIGFVQDNHARSGPAGTLRGLHFQAPPHAQTKLVRCVAGRIFDVAVDIRRGAASCGQWRGVELSAENGRQLLVPKGFLHGYLTLTDAAEVQYKVDAHYCHEADGAVAWNDTDIAVAWPLAEAGVTAPELSAKDAAAPRLADIVSPFRWNGDA